MQAALLPERGVVKVAGDDARHFLNGLATTDISKVAPGRARFGALLTPQGKIIVDFIVVVVIIIVVIISVSVVIVRGALQQQSLSLIHQPLTISLRRQTTL